MGRTGKYNHRKRLGDTIRARRNFLKLSQEELAEQVNCHRNYVGCVERGEQNLTVDMLMRFAGALKCTLETIARESKI